MSVAFFEGLSLTVRSEQFDGGKKVTLHAYATSEEVPAGDVLRAVVSYLDAGLLELEDQ